MMNYDYWYRSWMSARKDEWRMLRYEPDVIWGCIWISYEVWRHVDGDSGVDFPTTIGKRWIEMLEFEEWS